MSGAWRNWKADTLGVNVMALRGSYRGPDARQLMAGCKRKAGRHSTAALDAAFSRFIEVVDSGEAGKRRRLGSFDLEKLLISPEFTPVQCQRARAAGYTAMGIKDMARQLGIVNDPDLEDEP